MAPKSVIAGVRGELPPHRYTQDEITDEFVADAEFEGFEEILRSLHRSAKVDHRHLALPLEQYTELCDFGQSNSVFIDTAVDLGCAAVRPPWKTPDSGRRTST